MYNTNSFSKIFLFIGYLFFFSCQPDKDMDGIKAKDDCDDNNPFVPALPGTPCDDGNSQTDFDLIQADFCTCQGEEIFVNPGGNTSGSGGNTSGSGENTSGSGGNTSGSGGSETSANCNPIENQFTINNRSYAINFGFISNDLLCQKEGELLANPIIQEDGYINFGIILSSLNYLEKDTYPLLVFLLAKKNNENKHDGLYSYESNPATLGVSTSVLSLGNNCRSPEISSVYVIQENEDDDCFEEIDLTSIGGFVSIITDNNEFSICFDIETKVGLGITGSYKGDLRRLGCD